MGSFVSTWSVLGSVFELGEIVAALGVEIVLEPLGEDAKFLHGVGHQPGVGDAVHGVGGEAFEGHPHDIDCGVTAPERDHVPHVFGGELLGRSPGERRDEVLRRDGALLFGDLSGLW